MAGIRSLSFPADTNKVQSGTTQKIKEGTISVKWENLDAVDGLLRIQHSNFVDGPPDDFENLPDGFVLDSASGSETFVFDFIANNLTFDYDKGGNTAGTIEILNSFLYDT